MPGSPDDLIKPIHDRYRNGELPKDFERNLPPLVAGIGKAKTVKLREGLPHQSWEQDLLAAELKDKKTVQFHDFPFYDGPITLGDGDAKALVAVCGEGKTFRRYRGPKRCGGFHPDWCIEFKDGSDVYQVLFCFGCHEARLYGPTSDVWSDLDDKALTKIIAVLGPLRKNRPKPDSEK